MARASKLTSRLANHPAGVFALGLGPLVANSHTILSALLIAAAFVMALLFSAVTLSILRNLVPRRSRLIFILLISSTWVTILDLLLQAFVFDIRMAMDIYLPLLAMNSLLLMVMEKDALVLPPGQVAATVLAISILPAVVCLGSGLLRELLVHGTLFTELMTGRTPSPVMGLSLFATVAGAFIITGCMLALFNQLLSYQLDTAVAGRKDRE